MLGSGFAGGAEGSELVVMAAKACTIRLTVVRCGTVSESSSGFRIGLDSLIEEVR